VRAAPGRRQRRRVTGSAVAPDDARATTGPEIGEDTDGSQILPGHADFEVHSVGRPASSLQLRHRDSAGVRSNGYRLGPNSNRSRVRSPQSVTTAFCWAAWIRPVGAIRVPLARLAQRRERCCPSANVRNTSTVPRSVVPSRTPKSWPETRMPAGVPMTPAGFTTSAPRSQEVSHPNTTMPRSRRRRWGPGVKKVTGSAGTTKSRRTEFGGITK